MCTILKLKSRDSVGELIEDDTKHLLTKNIHDTSIPSLSIVRLLFFYTFLNNNIVSKTLFIFARRGII